MNSYRLIEPETLHRMRGAPTDHARMALFLASRAPGVTRTHDARALPRPRTSTFPTYPGISGPTAAPDLLAPTAPGEAASSGTAASRVRRGLGAPRGHGGGRRAGSEEPSTLSRPETPADSRCDRSFALRTKETSHRGRREEGDVAPALRRAIRSGRPPRKGSLLKLHMCTNFAPGA